MDLLPTYKINWRFWKFENLQREFGDFVSWWVTVS